MRSVVVGGAGFLGSHMVEHLVERGDDVVVVDNLVAGREEFVHPKASFHNMPMWYADEKFLKGVHRLYNYAAYPYVPDGFTDPRAVFSNNATAAVALIECAHKAGVERILQVSSAELYGGLVIGTAANEETPVQPHSTYGASKAAVDYFCQAAWRERGVPVIALRQFNCVGERETHPYIVPEIIDQLRAGPTVRLGNNSYRDLMYAGDAVAVAALLLERSVPGQVYNLGSGKAVQMYELAAMMGAKSVEFDRARVRPWDIDYLCSDNSKVKFALGGFALLPLRSALRKTADWAKENEWPWKRTKS